MKMTIYAAFFTIGLASTGVASASDPASTRVSYNDSDIATPQGIVVLQQRVQIAARRVCAEEYAGSLAASDGEAECRVAAYAKAARQIETLVRNHTALLAAATD